MGPQNYTGPACLQNVNLGPRAKHKGGRARGSPSVQCNTLTTRRHTMKMKRLNLLRVTVVTMLLIPSDAAWPGSVKKWFFPKADEAEEAIIELQAEKQLKNQSDENQKYREKYHRRVEEFNRVVRDYQQLKELISGNRFTPFNEVFAKAQELVNENKSLNAEVTQLRKSLVSVKKLIRRNPR